LMNRAPRFPFQKFIDEVNLMARFSAGFIIFGRRMRDSCKEKPNKVTPADGGWRVPFAFVALLPATAEFLR